MNMSFDNSNTCFGYKIAFYRYVYNKNNYRTVNININQLCISNMKDEQLAIVNNLKTYNSIFIIRFFFKIYFLCKNNSIPIKFVSKLSCK